MKKMTVRDLNIKAKKVFVRVDFNVPLTKVGEIGSDTRIRAALTTIKYIIKQNGIVILASHLGKPKGKIDLKLSLRPVSKRLSQLLNQKVIFVEDCVGPAVRRIIAKSKPKDVILLENLRFHPEEKENEKGFSRSLASLADLYVNDAFGTAHRKHSSIVGMTKFFSKPAAGFLMEKEIKYLSYAVSSVKHPYIAIIGGAKITDKLGVIKNLLTKVDNVLLGGGLFFNFFKVKGYEIGRSIFERKMLKETKELIKNDKVKLPSDVIVADKIGVLARIKAVKASEIPKNWFGVDIGPQTCQDYGQLIKKARTIIWVGPMGIFEIDNFSIGSKKIALAVGQATKKGAISIAGGGDTLAFLNKFRLINKVRFASTGGGASLQFLEGRVLPGIAVLKERE